MQPQSLLRAWKTKPWMKRLSGLTLPPSTAERGAARWISSLAATRASQTPLRDRGRGAQTTAGLSTTFCGPSRKAGLRVYSGKTYRGTRTDSLTLSSDHWSGWVATLRQEYSAREKRARATAGNDCSSWPTADAMVANDGQDPSTYNARRARLKVKHGNGNGAGLVLSQSAIQWQTPATDSFRSRGGDRKNEMGLDQQARLWPTAATRDYKGSLPLNQRDRTMGTLDECAERIFPYSPPAPTTQAGNGSSSGAPTLPPLCLNAAFVEWLMGWPTGWTDSARAVTGFTLWLRRSRTCLSTLISEPEQGELI